MNRKPNEVYAQSDFSQLEVRLFASVKAEGNKPNIHRAEAARGVPLEDVSDEMRAYAKRVNFLRTFGCSEADAIVIAHRDDF